MNINPDGTGTFIAYLKGSNNAIVLHVTINTNGFFTVSGAKGQSADQPTHVETRVVTDTVSGTIASGQVTGLADGLTLSGILDPVGGPDTSVAGYYTATALYSGTSTTYTIVGPSGETVAVIVAPTSSDSATGTTSASGQFTATTAAGSTLALSVDGQTLTESLTLPGSSTPIAGSGLSANIARTSRLINLSVRGNVGTGPNILIAGFVTGGTGSKSILVRGIGPTLSSFGVTGTLAAPQLTLFDSSGASILSNSGWGGSTTLSQTFSQLGAFALPATSADSAILQTLGAGSYTAQLSGSGGTSGIGLTELYDADTGFPSARLINISARGQVGTGGNILIAGFVISGNSTETVLLRGVGPTLSQFNLSGALAAPQLTLFDSTGKKIDSSTTWGGSSALSSVFTQVGAFSLPSTSADSVLLENLPPGSYTVQLSGVSGATGTALIEVYEVP